MGSPLVAKLQHSGFLRDEDVETLDDVTKNFREVEAHHDLIQQGDRPERLHLVLAGWAVRYKVLTSGSRQIVALFLPGDFCDLHAAVLGHMDHSIATVSACRIVEVPQTAIETLLDAHPRVRKAFWWATLIDEAVLRAWLTNLGQRPAAQKLAHLLCEILFRLQMVNLAENDGFWMPITQTELGDALGLSTVHVNRSMQELRHLGVVSTQGRNVLIPDFDRCAAFCDFDSSYLHPRKHLD